MVVLWKPPKWSWSFFWLVWKQKIAVCNTTVGKGLPAPQSPWMWPAAVKLLDEEGFRWGSWIFWEALAMSWCDIEGNTGGCNIGFESGVMRDMWKHLVKGVEHNEWKVHSSIWMHTSMECDDANICLDVHFWSGGLYRDIKGNTRCTIIAGNV